MKFPSSPIAGLSDKLFSPYFHSALLLLVAAALLGSSPAWAEPFVPEDDHMVLERLPFSPGDPSVRELREQRAQLARNPSNVALAVETAKEYINRGRSTGDPRYFGYAQAALDHWWDETQPPPEVLVLRATIRQSSHDFAGAITDLDRLLENDPDNFNAWLTRAIIFQVKGDYDDALQSCRRSMQATQGSASLQLLSATCANSVASFNGKAQESFDDLRRALQVAFGASDSERQWALTTLADIATRLGQTQVAETYFDEALALGRDNWLFGTYADFLIDQDRAREAVELLKDETSVDTLLLLLALAEHEVGSPNLAEHVRELGERFEASNLRNDQRHLREEARFALYLMDQPDRALELAKANWAIQHEPEDARILLEAALAADQPEAARPVLEFMDRTGLQDVRLAPLEDAIEDQLEGMSA